MRVTIQKGSIEIVQGDITEESTDAIVNAANNYLWMGTGVAGALKRKGGEAIEREAIERGPIGVGEAVITSAGLLKAKHVIHAAVMGQDLHTDATKIAAATRSALRLAEAQQLSSVSFPALGTGVGGFSPYHCARIMESEAIEFLQSAKFLRTIRFVLFDTPTREIFEQELKLQFSTTRHAG